MTLRARAFRQELRKVLAIVYEHLFNKKPARPGWPAASVQDRGPSFTLLKTAFRNRSTRSPMPGFFDSRFPATFKHSICGCLRSQATTSDTSTTSLGVTGMTGY